MLRLNYHHLLYFWTVVREGSVSAASRKLRVAQPTVSEQLKALEEMLELELFRRVGGKLVLTEGGAHVYRYADEIFILGHELQESLRGRSSQRRTRLMVGITDAVPKLVASRILAPVLGMKEEVRMVCHENTQERLLAELAAHSLDVVVSDAPVAADSNVRAYDHLLGESGVTLFARKELAERLRRHFPRSLDGVPLLLPAENNGLRRALTQWMADAGLHPRIRGEFQDSALLKAFGQLGAGVFPGPTFIEQEIQTQYGVEVVGRLDEVRERFYAITVERRLHHPAVQIIYRAARESLFPRPEGG
ncbi:MAG TPA: transcriptional activator NhaR [Archangium sp.]|uniref:transcriptional activator NhaR n=1 Tax=Archangium sp. TaxID=1872627 RepID=UPI002E35D842|nr:transcriptional activator NhaR [Archangium sp.]HEX5749331.1 transcriptional activator NhaR [Archangium sp.]